MRKQIAGFLLVGSVVVWGVWCGGQYFNEARVIPKMLSSPPESVIAYRALRADYELPFFFPLNPLIFLLPLAALCAAWKSAHESKKWLVLTAALGGLICLALILYLAPLIGGVVRDAGTVPALETITRARAWRFGNQVRLIAELIGFICSISALRVWSSETADLKK